MERRRVVLVTGATGLVGARLVDGLLTEGAVVRALTRDLKHASATLHPQAILLRWDGAKIPVDAVHGVDAVVHLAGEPVFQGRLTDRRRERIRESRVASTRSLVDAIGALPDDERPGVLVNASAVGFYGSRGDEVLDEEAPAGEGFLADVCRAWEEHAAAAQDHGVRTVRLRLGIVLAREGGALPRLALPFRAGLGGRLGSGRQWVPWIHIDDLVAMIRASIEDDGWQGAVNGVAPEPARNAELTRTLARVLRRPAWFPAPALLLRGALGELAEELLGSRRVVPSQARARGFAYRYAALAAALEAELRPTAAAGDGAR